MSHYKLVFTGPQTSKSIGGVHLPKGTSIYLTKEQLPLPLKTLKKENVEVEKVEDIPTVAEESKASSSNITPSSPPHEKIFRKKRRVAAAAFSSVL